MMDGLLGLPNKDTQYLEVIFVVVLVGLTGLHALQKKLRAHRTGGFLRSS